MPRNKKLEKQLAGTLRRHAEMQAMNKVTDMFQEDRFNVCVVSDALKAKGTFTDLFDSDLYEAISYYHTKEFKLYPDCVKQYLVDAVLELIFPGSSSV